MEGVEGLSVDGKECEIRQLRKVEQEQVCGLDRYERGDRA